MGLYLQVALVWVLVVIASGMLAGAGAWGGWNLLEGVRRRRRPHVPAAQPVARRRPETAACRYQPTATINAADTLVFPRHVDEYPDAVPRRPRPAGGWPPGRRLTPLDDRQPRW